MIVAFEESYLKDLFEKGSCKDKKHRYQPNIIKLYQRRVEQLQAAPNPETLYQLNSLHFEALIGDKAGLYSIRVNEKYRVEFSLNSDSERPLLTICNIVELSNHYD
ncbi:MAG: type II toxin-antitoxin system RelE/ParE family toxin [Muribaculaceae bacterium]|nr:type II toxin-antitoxin system RelE/ParE family toxin [Muribaculaceae bacterium]MDE5844757.1 type II toxin-antitoxin system RelE/ParE family toxin [Muribaculaceae bacterium]MDE5858486.1 type II toxin-antitoxin system RelE/ParE family toxin [Muribaculaceae bacterium]